MGEHVIDIGAQSGDHVLLTALADLAGWPDQLVLGLLPAGQARLRRVAHTAEHSPTEQMSEIYAASGPSSSNTR